MFDSDYEPPEVETRIKEVEINKYRELVDKIKDKIISLQDEVILGIGGTRSVQEIDITRYRAMIDVLKAMIQ